MAKSKDPIRLAKDMFDEFLSKADPKSVAGKPTEERNAQQKAAGKLGGLAGGPARKESLTPRKRKEIAKKAAKTRWSPFKTEKPTITKVSQREDSAGKSVMVVEEVESPVPKIHDVIKRIEPASLHLICIFTSTDGYGYSIDVNESGFQYGKDFFGYRSKKAAESAALAQYESVKKELSSHLVKRAEQRAKRKGKLVNIADARDRRLSRRQPR